MSNVIKRMSNSVRLCSWHRLTDGVFSGKIKARSAHHSDAESEKPVLFEMRFLGSQSVLYLKAGCFQRSAVSAEFSC